MNRKFCSFLKSKEITQWNVIETEKVLELLYLPEKPYHIDVDKTRSLLKAHTHLFMFLYPVPGPLEESVSAQGPVIAPFARKHYYKDAVHILKDAFAILAGELAVSKKNIRIFSNSRFPEKELARIAGLGFIGRNTLLINSIEGSSAVIAGAALGLTQDQAETLRDYRSIAPASSGCGTCTACVKSCPTGAISRDPKGFKRNRCLQYLSTETEGWNDEIHSKWGTRLYGCMDCQSVCPWNKKIKRKIIVGNSQINNVHYLELIEQFRASLDLKEIFPETALEVSWMPREAILRNLITAAANARLSTEEARRFYNVADSLPETVKPGVKKSMDWFRRCNPEI